MFRRLATTILLALFACSDETGDKRAKCVELREHAAEVSVAARTGNLLPDEQAKHTAALVASSGEELVRRCVESWSEKSIECALGAESGDALRRCVARK